MDDTAPVSGTPSSADDNALRVRLMALFDGASLETLPAETSGKDEVWQLLPRGTRVFVTRLPQADFCDTVEAARRLRRRGLEPVPHVSARATVSAESLENTLSRLAGEAGVDDILLIAGGDVAPAGPFDDTLKVLESGALERAGIRRLGVAGHPEGHPQAGNDSLIAALAAKNEFARRSGIEAYVVTQFFFDSGPVVAWERQIRAAGNRLPVHPGLHGVTGTARLMKYAMACGVGVSLDMLRRRATTLIGLAGAQAPGRLAVELARASLADPESAFAAFHLFPLGGLEATVRWAAALREGRFRLTGDGDIALET